MSIVSGSLGAVMGADAQTSSADKQREATLAGQQVTKDIYEQQRSDFAPFLGLGTGAINSMNSFDPMAGVGDAPNYDDIYTSQLGNYNEDPGTTAMKSLGSNQLAKQRAARVGYGTPGADANAQAELAQKYDITGYDKYKQQLSDRYKAKQGEFSQRRDINNTNYNQILDKIKIGQGAANSTGQAGSAYATNASNAFNQLGQAAANSGNAQANLWSGLGAQAGNTASLGLKAYQTGKDNGWFSSTGNDGLGSAWGAGSSGAAGMSADEAAAYFA